MIVAVVGTGYVGLITGLCLADAGFRVHGIDRNEVLCSRLNSGIATIHEAGLEPLLKRVLRREFASFTSDLSVISEADMVFVAVGTPTDERTGEADLSALRGVVVEMAPFLKSGVTVVVKSTVPVGTNRAVAGILREARPDLDFSVASNPEFLREGSAIQDFNHADRIVCGVSDEAARRKFTALYAHWVARGTTLAFTSPENAELSKYAANAFLAMKVTFINEMADLCEAAGGDVEHVAALMGMDARIGRSFLQAGPGYGGSCFPKDTNALVSSAAKLGVDASLVRATVAANESRKRRMAERVIAALGGVADKRIAVLGIAFKAGTDDVRDSVSLELLPRLQEAGASIRAHDPKAMSAAAKLLPDVSWHESALEAAVGCDAVLLLTDWPDYALIPPVALAKTMRGKHLFDFRNLFSAAEVSAAGLLHVSIGRGADVGGGPLEIESAPQQQEGAAIHLLGRPVREFAPQALEAAPSVVG